MYLSIAWSIVTWNKKYQNSMSWTTASLWHKRLLHIILKFVYQCTEIDHTLFKAIILMYLLFSLKGKNNTNSCIRSYLAHILSFTEEFCGAGGWSVSKPKENVNWRYVNRVELG
jgi:hypothetical protein